MFLLAKSKEGKRSVLEGYFQQECVRKMLKSKRIMEIPVETSNVAKGAIPTCNISITLRDGLGTIFEGDLFVDLYTNLV